MLEETVKSVVVATLEVEELDSIVATEEVEELDSVVATEEVEELDSVVAIEEVEELDSVVAGVLEATVVFVDGYKVTWVASVVALEVVVETLED